MNSLSSFDVTVVVVMLSYRVPGGSSLLDVCEVHGVVVRVFCLYGKLRTMDAIIMSQELLGVMPR